MLAKTYTYTDYNGVERKETLHFNLTETELVKLNVDEDGGLKEILERIIDAKNGREIGKWFDRIILMAYGEKSDDGRYFMKSEEISNRFKCSPLYDLVYREINSDASVAAAFIEGILPKEMVAKAKAAN